MEDTEQQVAVALTGPEERTLVLTGADPAAEVLSQPSHTSMATGSANLQASPDAVTTPSTPASTQNGEAALAAVAGPSSPTVVLGSNRKGPARSKTTGKVVLRMKASTLASPPASAPPTRTSTRSGRATAGSASTLKAVTLAGEAPADGLLPSTTDEVPASMASPVVSMLAYPGAATLATKDVDQDAPMQASPVDVLGKAAEVAAQAGAAPAGEEALVEPSASHQAQLHDSSSVQSDAAKLTISEEDTADLAGPDAPAAATFPASNVSEQPASAHTAAHLAGAVTNLLVVVPVAENACGASEAATSSGMPSGNSPELSCETLPLAGLPADSQSPIVVLETTPTVTAADAPTTALPVPNASVQVCDHTHTSKLAAATENTAAAVEETPSANVPVVAAPSPETTHPPPPPPPPPSADVAANSVSAAAVAAAAAAFAAAVAQLSQLDAATRTTAAAGDFVMGEQEQLEADVLLMDEDEGDEGGEEEGSEHGSGWEDAEYDDDAGGELQEAASGDVRMLEELEGFDNDRDFEDEDYRLVDEDDMDVDAGGEAGLVPLAEGAGKVLDPVAVAAIGTATAAPATAAATAAVVVVASDKETAGGAKVVKQPQQQPSSTSLAKSDSIGRGQHANKVRSTQEVLAPITVKLILTGRAMTREASLDTGAAPPGPAAISSLLSSIQPLSEAIVFEGWDSHPHDTLSLTVPRKPRVAGYTPHESPPARRTVVFNDRDVNLMQVLSENNDTEMYTNQLVKRLAFDPCAVDAGYAVGFKRLSGILEQHAVREIMAFHTTIKSAKIAEFGLCKEGEIRKPQAWVLTNCRAMMAREVSLSKELAFSHTYTLGCYRVDALMSEALKRVLDRLPVNKRRFSIFTLGQTDYTFLRRSPAAFFRLLLHTFTPDDLKLDLLRLYPIPGPRALCLTATGRTGPLDRAIASNKKPSTRGSGITKKNEAAVARASGTLLPRSRTTGALPREPATGSEPSRSRGRAEAGSGRGAARASSPPPPDRKIRGGATLSAADLAYERDRQERRVLAACATDSSRYESAHIRDRLTNGRNGSTAAPLTGVRGGAAGERNGRQGSAAAVQGGREQGGYAAATAAVANDAAANRGMGGRKRSVPDGAAVSSRGGAREEEGRGEKRRVGGQQEMLTAGLAGRQQANAQLNAPSTAPSQYPAAQEDFYYDPPRQPAAPASSLGGPRPPLQAYPGQPPRGNPPQGQPPSAQGGVARYLGVPPAVPPPHPPPLSTYRAPVPPQQIISRTRLSPDPERFAQHAQQQQQLVQQQQQQRLQQQQQQGFTTTAPAYPDRGLQRYAHETEQLPVAGARATVPMMRQGEQPQVYSRTEAQQPARYLSPPRAPQPAAYDRDMEVAEQGRGYGSTRPSAAPRVGHNVVLDPPYRPHAGPTPAQYQDSVARPQAYEAIPKRSATDDTYGSAASRSQFAARNRGEAVAFSEQQHSQVEALRAPVQAVQMRDQAPQYRPEARNNISEVSQNHGEAGRQYAAEGKAYAYEWQPHQQEPQQQQQQPQLAQPRPSPLQQVVYADQQGYTQQGMHAPLDQQQRGGPMAVSQVSIAQGYVEDRSRYGVQVQQQQQQQPQALSPLPPPPSQQQQRIPHSQYQSDARGRDAVMAGPTGGGRSGTDPAPLTSQPLSGSIRSNGRAGDNERGLDSGSGRGRDEPRREDSRGDDRRRDASRDGGDRRRTDQAIGSSSRRDPRQDSVATATAAAGGGEREGRRDGGRSGSSRDRDRDRDRGLSPSGGGRSRSEPDSQRSRRDESSRGNTSGDRDPRSSRGGGSKGDVEPSSSGRSKDREGGRGRDRDRENQQDDSSQRRNGSNTALPPPPRPNSETYGAAGVHAGEGGVAVAPVPAQTQQQQLMAQLSAQLSALQQQLASGTNPQLVLPQMQLVMQQLQEAATSTSATAAASPAVVQAPLQAPRPPQQPVQQQGYQQDEPQVFRQQQQEKPRQQQQINQVDSQNAYASRTDLQTNNGGESGAPQVMQSAPAASFNQPSQQPPQYQQQQQYSNNSNSSNSIPKAGTPTQQQKLPPQQQQQQQQQQQAPLQQLHTQQQSPLQPQQQQQQQQQYAAAPMSGYVNNPQLAPPQIPTAPPAYNNAAPSASISASFPLQPPQQSLSAFGAAPAVVAPQPAPQSVPVRFSMAASSAPAPWRAMNPAKASQEDAFAYRSYSCAVADGLAATFDMGYPSGPYAKMLADSSVAVMEAAIQSLLMRGLGRTLPSPKDAMTLALQQASSMKGAASLLLVAADPLRALLHLATLGSCGHVLLRPNHATKEMEVVSLWRPFTETSSKLRYFSSPDLRPLIGGMLPEHSMEEELPVRPGDILIAGTHGLFDMVWMHGPLSGNVRQELYVMVVTQNIDPGVLASRLAGLASHLFLTNVAGTPLGAQLARDGRGLNPIQDIGDSTVLVMMVQAM